MKRPEINITPSERAGRILLGGVGAIIGLLLLASAAGTLAVVLEALLVLAGLDLVVTDALPAADGGFDATVTSLVLCSVADQAVALREIARALRPGGELRFYEHVVSHHPMMARVQRALDATILPTLAGGCHCARDTRAAILDAGFKIDHDERIVSKPSLFTLSIPHILGTARRA